MMNTQSQSFNVMADATGLDVKEISKQQSETIRTPSPNDSHYERANFAEIPVLVNGLLSDDPQMRAHITERLVSIALQDEDSGSSSYDLYLSPLIAMLKSGDEEKSQSGCDGLSIIVKKSEKFRQTLIRSGFLEIVRIELSDESLPEHVHSNILGIIIDLISNGCNAFEMSGLLSIVHKVGSDKDEKKKKISMKAKMIETLLTCQGVTSPCSIDEIQELKKQNEELKRLNEENIRLNEQKTKEIVELKRSNEDQKREVQKLQRKNQELEKNNLIIDIMKYQIPMQVLKKIGEDLMIPLEGTQEKKKKIIETQNEDSQLIIRTFEGKEDDEGRRRIIQSPVIEGFLLIMEKREMNEIPRNISSAFGVITHTSSDEIKLLIYSKKPFPGLLRLLDHTDDDVACDGIQSILNILLGGTNTTPDNSHHPHYQTINGCGGIVKIMKLFRKNGSKYSQDSAAFCIGFLFRAREINDKQMRDEIIRHLKNLVYDTDDWTKKSAKYALRGLAQNGSMIYMSE